uniref:Uncharacterized protein n=1 Tax=Setaria digitata TaxID=48799 RepID=A0A915Q0T5_9BILA
MCDTAEGLYSEAMDESPQDGLYKGFHLAVKEEVGTGTLILRNSADIVNMKEGYTDEERGQCVYQKEERTGGKATTEDTIANVNRKSVT